MRSSATPEFWAAYALLTPEIRARARRAYRLWQRDPRHGSLRFKKIGDMWSIRIGRDYRVLAILEEGTFHWFWIGPHDEYERILAGA